MSCDLFSWMFASLPCKSHSRDQDKYFAVCPVTVCPCRSEIKQSLCERTPTSPHCPCPLLSPQATPSSSFSTTDLLKSYLLFPRAGPSTLLPQLCVEFLPGPTPPTVPVSSEVCSTRSTNNATQILIAHFCAHSGNTLSVYATLFTTELFRSSLPLIYTASTFDTHRVFINRFDIPYVCSYSYRLSEVSVFDTDEFTLGR